MTLSRKWFWSGAFILAVAAAAIAMGTSVGTLLTVGAFLLCPAAMFFGMRGMGMGPCCGHSESCNHPDAHSAEHKTQQQEPRKDA
jgi:hypothetical protein